MFSWFKKGRYLVAMKQVFQTIPVPAVLTVKASGSRTITVYGVFRLQLRKGPNFHVSSVSIRRMSGQFQRVVVLQEGSGSLSVLFRHLAMGNRHVSGYPLRQCNGRSGGDWGKWFGFRNVELCGHCFLFFSVLDVSLSEDLSAPFFGFRDPLQIT